MFGIRIAIVAITNSLQQRQLTRIASGSGLTYSCLKVIHETLRASSMDMQPDTAWSRKKDETGRRFTFAIVGWATVTYLSLMLAKSTDG